MDDSVRVLAIAREKFVPDVDGREAATTALLEQFKEACRKAGLHLSADRGVDCVSLFNPPRVRLAIGTYSEDVEAALKDVPYDPIEKKYFETDPDGPDPLRILTDHIAAVLIAKTEKSMK